MRSLIIAIMSRCGCTAWSLCLTWALSSIALAQPSFEAASVKRHDPKDQTGFIPPTCENNRFKFRAMPIMQVLAWAYDVRTDQYLALDASLPSWARLEAYDIEAVSNKQMTTSQCRQAVQALLVDRFRMKSHWKVITNSPGYELRVAPKGHNLKPVSPTDTGCGVHISWEGQERPCDRYQMPFAPKRGMTMTELAKVLSIYTRQYPVRDLTGLGGEYKIGLSFTTQSANLQYPLLEQALQDQLGLAMRLAKFDLDVLIVDSIDRPTDN
jgi:uncharacterized protein (TIGR03435 family)